jgi:uncharacterized membrane protein YadS
MFSNPMFCVWIGVIVVILAAMIITASKEEKSGEDNPVPIFILLWTFIAVFFFGMKFFG